MKKILLFFAFSLPLLLCAQTPIAFEEVVKIDESTSKETLYNRGLHWVVVVFQNPKKVIQLKDKEEGQIVCKGSFDYKQKKAMWGAGNNTKGVIEFTVKLFFKEGRYKYVITDFTHVSNSGVYDFGIITDAAEYPNKMTMTSKAWRKWIWNDLKEQVELKTPVIVESLRSEMVKKVGSEDSDW